MKCLGLSLLMLIYVLNFQDCLAQNVKKGENGKLTWWQNSKFGLFLHWGLYSQTAGDWNGHISKGGEHFMLYERIPWMEYAKIADNFNPILFNADQYVKVAKQAGMKYIVITAKHHDGFAMYNSPSSTYNIVERSAYHKDPMKDLAAACKKYDVKLCFYYSLGRDWQDPDVPTNWPVKAGRSNTWDYPDEDAKVFNRYFERKVKPQITELLSNYGPIGVIWFDTPELISKKESAELKDLVNKLQPKCLINSRIGNGYGDFSVSEQSLTPASKKAWESCLTIGQNWGYNRHDSTWKSPEILVRHLVEVVANGGNLLLNVGPKGDGALPDWATERLESIGKWMAVNSEAIYDTQPWLAVKESSNVPIENQSIETSKNAIKDAVFDGTPKSVKPDIYYSTKGNFIYVFLRSWQKRDFQLKQLPQKGVEIKRIQLIGSKDKVEWSYSTNELNLVLPKNFNATNNIPVYVLKITTTK